MSFVRDLPKEIPQQLSVGTKVTARLRAPQDGLFTGTVEAIDVMSSSYRVCFGDADLSCRFVFIQHKRLKFVIADRLDGADSSNSLQVPRLCWHTKACNVVRVLRHGGTVLWAI